MSSKYSILFWDDATALVAEHTKTNPTKLIPYKLIAQTLITKYEINESADKIRKSLESHFRRANGRAETINVVEKKPNVPSVKVELTPVEKIIQDRKVRVLEGEIKLLKATYKESLAQNELLSLALDSALGIGEEVDTTPIVIESHTPNGEAVPLIQWSDWHCEERVDADTIEGLNHYNPDIARKRAFQLAQNSLRLVQKERKDINISECFLSLGGDFINNFLHDHDTRNNYMSPIEATRFAKELLIKNITFLLEYGGFKKLNIACVRGNHSRQTHRMSASDDYRMNYEHMLYLDLKEYFDGKGADINWHIPKGSRAYVEILGRTIRVFHGWEVKFKGGVGGLTIPLYKQLYRWDDVKKADFNLMHDKHQWYRATPNCQINGSMVGYNAYAMSCGFGFQPPLQAFTLLDKKRGFQVNTAINCE